LRYSRSRIAKPGISVGATQKAIDSQPEPAAAWNRSVPTWNRSVVLLVIAVAAYFQTWMDLWPFWENKDATYTHGTLIAVVAVWLVWRARTALVTVEPSPSAIGLVLLVVLSAVWMLAAHANVFIVYAM